MNAMLGGENSNSIERNIFRSIEFEFSPPSMAFVFPYSDSMTTLLVRLAYAFCHRVEGIEKYSGR